MQSRLALEVAHTLEHFYEQGVRFVALAGVTSADAVAGAIYIKATMRAG